MACGLTTGLEIQRCVPPPPPPPLLLLCSVLMGDVLLSLALCPVARVVSSSLQAPFGESDLKLRSVTIARIVPESWTGGEHPEVSGVEAVLVNSLCSDCTLVLARVVCIWAHLCSLSCALIATPACTSDHLPGTGAAFLVGSSPSPFPRHCPASLRSFVVGAGVGATLTSLLRTQSHGFSQEGGLAIE